LILKIKGMKNVPKHVAIICDGNRRWAKKKGFESFVGHKAAAENVFEPIVRKASEIGIKYLTFWVFSTENWGRGENEVSWLMNIFRDFFDKKIGLLDKENYKVVHIGRKDRLPKDISEKISYVEEKTKDNTGTVIVLAMDYGGRDEIIRGIKKIFKKIQDKEFEIENLNEENLSQFLDTCEIPDPDLIIRTGGEKRLSGFLLWQQKHSELYFTDTLFPDFDVEEFWKALEDFQKRERRFGS